MTLSACSTTSEKPILINKECVPPQEVATKHSDLPTLSAPMTEKQMLDQWIDDMQAYNTLNIEHSALIDWVNKYCK